MRRSRLVNTVIGVIVAGCSFIPLSGAYEDSNRAPGKTLERGKSADIAIWDRDPYKVSTNLLKEMVCEMTLFQGNVVYEHSSRH
jgi:hypothetical protein